nr:YcaO-like family protein [uncultured Rhodococcus sp.]
MPRIVEVDLLDPPFPCTSADDIVIVFAENRAVVYRLEVDLVEIIDTRWIESVLGAWGRTFDPTEIVRGAERDPILEELARDAVQQLQDSTGSAIYAIELNPWPRVEVISWIQLVELLTSTYAPTDDLTFDFAAPLDGRRIDIATLPVFANGVISHDLLGAISVRPRLGDSDRLNVGAYGFTARNEGHVGWSGHGYTAAFSQNAAVLECLERGASITAHSFRTSLKDSELRITPTELGHNTDTAVYEWVPGVDPLTNNVVHVPARCVFYLDASLRTTFPETSNGAALGATLEEATVAALCELIERDALITSWYSGVRPPVIVGLEDAGDHILDGALERCRVTGFTAKFYDLGPTTVGAVVLCALQDRQGNVGMGSSCAMSTHAAARTALGEAASVLSDLPRLARSESDKILLLEDEPKLVDALRDHTLLLITNIGRAHVAEYLSSPHEVHHTDVRRDAATDLGAFLELLLPRSNTVVVDTTDGRCCELGLRTVKIVAPGLVPIDFGWSRQRAVWSSCYRDRIESMALAAGTCVRDIPHPFP